MWWSCCRCRFRSYIGGKVEFLNWVKNNAGWWATDQIEDADFVNGIEYLISKDIIGIDNEKIKGTSTD